MCEQFDHEKLDVYKVSLEFVAWVSRLVSGLSYPFHIDIQRTR